MGTKAVMRASWMAGFATAAALVATPVIAEPSAEGGSASTTSETGTSSSTTAATPAPPDASPASEVTDKLDEEAKPEAADASKPDAAAPGTADAGKDSKDEANKDQAATPPSGDAKQDAAAAPSPAATEDAKSEDAKPADAAASTAPASPSASPDETKTNNAKATDAPATETTAAAAPPIDPAVAAVVTAAVEKLSDKTFVKGFDKDDVEALNKYYGEHPAPLWIKDGALSPKANEAIAEIRKADDWGLDASAFELPELAAGAPSADQGAAEAKLSLAVLRYARYARGGRVKPTSISSIWDMQPPVKQPADVLAEISASATPGSYLTGLNPKHPQFEKLRQAMLKARGPQDEEKIDEALKVELPRKGTVKPGQENDDIALLRKRLKTPAENSEDENVYDAVLVEAVKAFQQEKGIKANGYLNSATRAALNAEGKPKKRDGKAEIDRIIANMERWRWLPEDLGEVYVMNNIPEYVARAYKGDEKIFEERIIVGQTTWPTPMLSSTMLYVMFRPTWGVPDGIKMKELLPRLKQASGGGFFDQLFGGGSSGGGRVLKAYGLRPTLNGRPVDPDSIDWSKVDIRRFSFTQPPGGQNPLGDVKFRFPNSHDVYMHDTTQKALFKQSFRALSHGCIRVQNPERLAEVLLEQDKGWPAAKVRGMFNSGGDVTLEKPLPVYLAYFTARVDEEGKLRTYSDVYGNDGRLLSALAGRNVRYSAPAANSADTVAAIDDDQVDVSTGSTDVDPQPATTTSRKSNKKKEQTARRSTRTTNDIMSNALSGLVAN
ncbi:MAG: murein L,D-transpeptidase [Hyphomicrobium sp.]